MFLKIHPNTLTQAEMWIKQLSPHLNKNEYTVFSAFSVRDEADIINNTKTVTYRVFCVLYHQQSIGCLYFTTEQALQDYINSNMQALNYRTPKNFH